MLDRARTSVRGAILAGGSATRFGNIPQMQAFTPGPEWQEHVIPFKAFSNMDGDDVRGILFSASAMPGSFRFAIDDVRLR